MIIGGVEIKGPNEQVLVFTRGEQLVPFKGRAITSFEELERLNPEPKVPVLITPKGTIENREEPNYVSDRLEYLNRRAAWIVLKTLEPTNIPFKTVDMEVPSTWVKYHQELLDAGFTEIELNRIFQFVLQVNALDEQKLDWARNLFLQGQVVLPAH